MEYIALDVHKHYNLARVENEKVDKLYNWTVSAGVAQANEYGAKPNELLRAADEAPCIPLKTPAVSTNQTHQFANH